MQKEVQSFFNIFKTKMSTVKDVISIRDIRYHEIINATYNLSFNFDEQDIHDFIKAEIQSPHKDDEQERSNLLNQLFLKLATNKELFSRQLVITPKYIGSEELQACISCIQVLIRKDSAYLNIYMRSQNIDNFIYNNQTFILLAGMASLSTKTKNCNIHVTIASLHQIIK